MIKVIIANNNDILYNRLSNITLQYKGKIELTNVPKDKLKNFICRIKPREQLILLIKKNLIFSLEKSDLIFLY